MSVGTPGSTGEQITTSCKSRKVKSHSPSDWSGQGITISVATDFDNDVLSVVNDRKAGLISDPEENLNA